jgi:serine/threonine protein kinase
MITSYLHCSFAGSFFYIVTDYAEKGDLRAFIHDHARTTKTYFKEGFVLDLFIQIVIALQYVHGKGILHRDIKTANIFLKEDNHVKLGDFGICRSLHGDSDDARTIIGTPSYISPEICRHQRYVFLASLLFWFENKEGKEKIHLKGMD